MKTTLTIENLPADYTPDRLSSSLFESPHFVLLESSLEGSGGRYTLAAANPRIVFEAKSNTDDPFDFLKRQLREMPFVDAPDLPFAGGWIGYLGYELYSLLEKKVPQRETVLLPRAVFGFYDQFYVYDHLKETALLISVDLGVSCKGPRTCLRPSFKKSDFEKRSPAAKAKSRNNAGRVPQDPEMRPLGPQSNFSKEKYLDSIHHIKNYITAGDCYQVNLSQQFTADFSGSPHEFYQLLRQVSPAPYAAYLNVGSAQIISSSPESFLQVDGRQVVTRPIKGTRPRGGSDQEDAHFKTELEQSQKDRAELLMITDLLRNDLGKVCRPNSIAVPDLQMVETYPQVHHLVATVRGELAGEADVVDLLRATFPGGSVTGAPKVRAMQIIRDLEPHAREIYCGAIGFIGLNGKSQFNVAIRTAVLKNQKAVFWAGGGIVADSDPEAEYAETLTKAKGIAQALRAEALTTRPSE